MCLSDHHREHVRHWSHNSPEMRTYVRAMCLSRIGHGRSPHPSDQWRGRAIAKAGVQEGGGTGIFVSHYLTPYLIEDRDGVSDCYGYGSEPGAPAARWGVRGGMGGLGAYWVYRTGGRGILESVPHR